MNYGRTRPASKGHLKCFTCRTLTKAREGQWHLSSNHQIFLCRTCGRPPAAAQAAQPVQQTAL